MTTSSILTAELAHYNVHTDRKHWRHWHKRKLVQIELLADGKPMVDYWSRNVYFERLKATLEGDGTYEIFCCSCGTIACDGLPYGAVKIRHEEGLVYWLHSGALPAASYLFDKVQYAEEILRLEEEVYVWFAAQKNYLDPRNQSYVVSPEEMYTDWRTQATTEK